MSEEVIIRELISEDMSAVAALERECFSAPWSENSLCSELKNPGVVFFGAFIGGELAGYGGMQCVADEGNVFNIAVAAPKRGAGIGRRIAERLVQEAAERALACMLLEVRPSNLAAIALYEKVGFVFCGLRRGYYTAPPENAILMSLALDGSGETEEFADDIL